MSSTLKKYSKIILPILLGVFLMWFSLQQVSFHELLGYFKNANYTWVGLGVLFGILSHLSRAYRWKYLLEPLGYRVDFWNSVMSVFSGYLINYTIPRAGEVARASLLTTYEEVEFEKVFGTIVAERMADLLMMVVVISMTLFIQFDFISSFFMGKFQSQNLGIGLFLLLLAFGAFAFLVFKSSSKWAIKIKHFVNGLVQGVLSITRMENKWAFMGHTVFIWVMYILMFYVVTFAVDELRGVTLGMALLGFISASFSIAATNAGIGAYPLAVFAAFSLYGLAKAPSLAFGWITWASQTFMLVLLGGLSLILLPIYNRLKNN
ncbi:lysylphosphatidylglycerol synthase transmembrane domain-containing protein [Mangrovimonas sp. ST2L15]|uniref:lysylphosphatidylglycerol synthase transmembrane domain-containing protein n=1 Tax=Mangrovimonas sp. ST2L15 TaxID=1645916 RepID=UPI0006B5A72D|nr:lysylphosphatidylglycerol synthase transmembrane domain-containing protein [Mangrovimonas sp. ST2L15]